MKFEIIGASAMSAGHVDPNHIDASAVVSIADWVMAELIREFHDIDIKDAQKIADSLVDRKIPLVWQSGDIRRVLNPTLSISTHVLLLSSLSETVTKDDLLRWIEPQNRSYFYQVLRQMHKSRLIELSSDETTIASSTWHGNR